MLNYLFNNLFVMPDTIIPEEIGIILKCSKRTVEIHLNNTKHKLGVSKIAQVTKMVIDSGIMEASKFDWEKK